MRNLITLNLLFISLFLFSQTNYDNRLNVKYSDEYLQNLNQNELKSLEFKLNNLYFIEDNFEKNESLPKLFKINNFTKEIIEEALTNVDFNNFNILNYFVEQNYNTRNYYKIGNTGKTLVVYSVKEYTEKYNNYNK
jgi:hypothetical protein